MEVQDAFPVVTLNREYLGEHGLQSQVFAPGLRDLRLEKLPIRIGLQFDEVGRGDDFFDFAEVDSFCCSRWHWYLFELGRPRCRGTPAVVSAKRHEARTLSSQRTCLN